MNMNMAAVRVFFLFSDGLGRAARGDHTAGIGAGIRHLNTFSGNEQDHKAGPVPVGFCGVGQHGITKLEVS